MLIFSIIIRSQNVRQVNAPIFVKSYFDIRLLLCYDWRARHEGDSCPLILLNFEHIEDHPAYVAHLSKDAQLYPSAINIELTTYCNLKCIMCAKTSGIPRTPPNRTIEPSVLDKIIRQVLPHISRIDLVGDGEIFLRPDLVIRILEAAQEHKVSVNASTNGVLINKKTAGMLVESSMHDLNISLDAATTGTFRDIRGADFHMVMKNIAGLNEIKSASGSSIPHIHFTMVGMKRNITELPDLMRLAHKYKADSVTLQAMGEFEPVKQESIYLRDKALGQQWYLKAKSVGEELGIKLHLWPEDQFEGRNTSENQNYATRPEANMRKDCYFPWDVPYFATDGSIRPCCAMPSFGNLNEMSFQDIWNGPEYRDLRKTIKSPNPPERCIRCPGRGWYSPIPVRPAVVIGENDPQLGTGWFEKETDSYGDYRWAREKATLFLQNKDAIALSMDLWSSSIALTTKRIRITIDGHPETDVVLDPGQKQQISLKLPLSEKDLRTIEMSGEPWRPVDTIPGSTDARGLTVKFYGANLEGRPAYADFERGVSLAGVEISGTHAISAREIPVTLFWDICPAFRDTARVFLHFYACRGKISSKKLLLNDIKTKLPGKAVRFQADADFIPERFSPELQKHVIHIPIPPDQPRGIYYLVAGLYRDSGSRFRVQKTGLHVYRNGLILDKINLIP